MLHVLGPKPGLRQPFSQTSLFRAVQKQPTRFKPRFGQGIDKKALKKETERLRKAESPAIQRRPIAALIHTILSPLSPSGMVTPLSSISNSQKIVEKYDKVFEPRAKFNLTGDGKHLNPFLPYRASIQNNPVKLAKYDRLVKRIQDKAQIGRTHSDKFALLIKMMSAAVGGDTGKLQSIMTETDINKKKALVKEKMKSVDVSKILKSDKLNDPSTGYMVAAAVVELFHNRPDMIDKVLDRKKPLKILVSKEPFLMPGGYYMPVHNLMALDGVTLWVGAQSSTQVPQHEFVHAASTRNEEAKPDFEEMSDTQKKTFVKIREALKKKYNENEGSFLGKLKYWWDGKPSTGIRPYAFLIDEEFITVTTDMFTRSPKQLQTTQEGKELYQLYKEFFGTDPDKHWQYSKQIQTNTFSGEKKD